MKKYFLVSDGEAGEIEKATGLKGRNTMLGALVEQPADPVIEAMRMGFQLQEIERAFNPPKPRCCYGGILHEPHCMTWGSLT